MYYIVVYDIASPRRLPKILKHCRRYFNWVQNSVFEGELTESQFEKFIKELNKKFNKSEDSVIIYSLMDKKWITRETIGIEKNITDNFI